MFGKTLRRIAVEAVDLTAALRAPAFGGEPGHDDVRRYYHECDYHYRLVCGDSESRPMHYGYYDARARTHREAVVRACEIMADAVGVGTGERVLDAGCGNGGSSLWLARVLAARCTGITLVPFQAERATRLAEERGLEDRCTFGVRDFGATGFDDASFDVVWFQESLAHAEDKPAVLREALRVLRPGGRLVVADIFRPRDGFSPSEEALLTHLLRGWVIPNLPTAAQMQTDLDEAGYENVRLDDVTRNVEPDAVRMRRLSAPVFLAAQPFRRLGLVRQVQYDNVAAGWYQLPALRQGLWLYAIVTARKPGSSA